MKTKDWVPVSLKLPAESEDRVLVKINGFPSYVGIASYRQHGQGTVWEMSWPLNCANESWVITHWQEIPR